MDKKEIHSSFTKYFEIVDSFFGSIKHYLGDEEDSHIDLGINISNYPLISDLIIDAIEDIDEEIELFWSENAKNIFDFVRNEDTLKCVYSGDISPVILENFVKKTSLYVDTVIIPDPIFNLSVFQRQIYLDKKKYLNKLIRHVFNVWKLKELILANVNELIIIILPINLQVIKEENRKKLLSTANKKFIEYVNLITNQKLNDLESCFVFFDESKTTKKLYKEFHNLHFLPNRFQDFKLFDQFLINFSKTGKGSPFEGKSAGWDFGLYLQSQFIRVQEHKYFCESINAEPIYDYELPWFFYNYEVGGLDMDAAIASALHKEKFEWINKVPIHALKVFREENKLDYMRNILRTGITDLKAKNDSDLSTVSEQLEKNLQEAFNQQKSEVKSLEEQVKKIIKKEMTITAGGFLAGFIPYLNNVVSLCTAGRDIRKLIKEKKEAERKLTEKQNNIINLLVKSCDE